MYAANYLCFLSGWNNLSTASLFARDGGACATEPGLVTKKGEPPRTSLLLSDAFQPPSLIFSSTLSEMRPAMLRCAAMSAWQLSSTLASFSLLLTSEASFNLSRAGQTIEFSPNDQALLNKRLQWQITDKSRGLRYVKLDPRDTHLLSQIGYVISLADATNKANVHWSSIKCKRVTHRRVFLAAELYAMTHRVDIEKRHWGRYQIVRAKFYQHKHYGMGKTSKDGTSEYWHLATFRKSCQCRDVVSQLTLGI